MEDIKVREYVRTKNKGIKRIDTIFENRTVNRYGYEIGSEWDGKLYSTIKTTDIVNHSKNIIDLIEVGDYVNGYKVEKVENGYVYVDYCWDCELYTLVTDNSDNIKSIVTKEQFENMEYKVGE